MLSSCVWVICIAFIVYGVIWGKGKAGLRTPTNRTEERMREELFEAGFQECPESPTVEGAEGEAYHGDDVGYLVDVLVLVHDVGCELWHTGIADDGHNEEG